MKTVDFSEIIEACEGGAKVYINGPGHMTKMGTPAHHSLYK